MGYALWEELTEQLLKIIGDNDDWRYIVVLVLFHHFIIILYGESSVAPIKIGIIDLALYK